MPLKAEKVVTECSNLGEGGVYKYFLTKLRQVVQ